MKKHTLITTSLLLALGLVTGCSSESDGGKAEAGSAAKGGSEASKPKGPVYVGPALPGLAKQQVWSLPPAKAIDLGDVLLFVKVGQGDYARGGYENDPLDGTVGTLFSAYSSDKPEAVTLEFRDVKTGAVRKSLDLKAGTVAATTWHNGVPAVAVTTTRTQESDGLSAQKSSITVTVYGADGARLGTIERDGDGKGVSIHEGHLIEQDGDATLTLTPIDGGAPRKVTCTGMLAHCSFDPRNNEIDGAQAHAPLITGAYAFHVENASTYETDPEQLVMSELATGKKVWSTADVAPPQGVELDKAHKRTSGAVRVLDVRDGRILTAWGADAFSPDTFVTATYDLASGKQVGGSTTYRYADFPGDTINTEGSSVFSPDHKLAAAHTKGGTALWDLGTGKELWKQGKGEIPLTPRRFSTNGVLYGDTDKEGGSGTSALAVDARTKKVLARDLPSDGIPLFSRSIGYGYLTTDDGFFVFPAERQDG
ncbi:hypothetical protein [Streptomyces sp. NRRL B-3648]|uniref:hypothetical protein n=1 Tax=Streptomyces sp. NRRL B-3648 TaxID=1519493 RepID=UPI0006AE4770|nr:hypothetical protein [Streptomyces sp. NRRL B-3648]KOV93770.1 hypothetical protein ADL04_26780 [Streptomyces sp. NRRL B-3648]